MFYKKNFKADSENQQGLLLMKMYLFEQTLMSNNRTAQMSHLHLLGLWLKLTANPLSELLEDTYEVV